MLSTKSRSSGGSGDYTYMSGTSMATPVSAGATALLLQHLIDNLNESNPSSALIKGIFAATSVDMAGQYGDVTDGAGQTAPNNHEGWGRIQLLNATSASFVDRESLSTGEERGWSINVPSAAPTMQIMLSYNDATSSPVVSANLVNDVDLSIKDPSGTWTNLSDNINNLKGLTFASPAQGVWEIHVVGTSVAPGVPQFFSVAVNSGYLMVNLTQDADFDGIVDENDQCAFTFGTSVHDRQGCPDTDGDGYSDPASNWSIAQGADVFIADNTQWADQDGDGYGDNSIGTNPDGCPSIAGTSTGDRYGCIDTDMDTFSDAESNLGGWTIAQGADACINVAGTSTGDRNGCPDEDGDTYSDPDPSGTNGSVWLVSNGADAFLGDNSQWNDTDSDGFGDNPPPATLGDACPTITGTSLADRIGCTDTDGDGYSDADLIWLAHPTGTADAFPNDITQWLDTDGDGYGDNQ
ncbi:MAG: S8 family serine peptidase, partial [Candidatus Poseidoniaceae archaeon]|nr:S8 family serine peptidase [Candidatus Poseidoniaceae archaeon]